MPALGERLQRLVDDVLARVTTSDAESAFALGTWLATLLWKNHSTIYRLDALETALLDKVPAPTDLPLDHPSDGQGEIHLATDVYRSGGHSPLMANLIRHANRQTQVVLTRMLDVGAAAEVLGVAPEQVRSAAHVTSAATRVQTLVQMLLRGHRIVASLHPNDVVGAVALRMAKRIRPDLQIGFVNHADHVFSVAIGAADVVLEISGYGWGLRAPRQTEASSSFMGIPIPARPPNRRENSQQGSPVFLSGGSAYKFRPLPGMALPPTLSRLLTQHPHAHLTVLGPKARDWWWWPLRVRHGKRVSIRSALPKAAYQRLLSSCTVYIDSHPILGGTALPEALMSGCDVAGIQGVAWGYSAADELLSPTPEAFLASCDALIRRDPDALAQQAALREACRRLHDPAAVRMRLDAAFAGQRMDLPPPSGGSARPQKARPLERPLERLWERSGKLWHPGRKECPLKTVDKRWLAGRHLVHFGLTSWSSLKLLFYAWARA